LWLILGIIGSLVLACLLMPDERPAPTEGNKSSPFKLLLDRRFMIFVVAASLMQASHGVYYGFGTLHWRALGFGEELIGFLWAEGVVVEILLFAVSGAAVARLGPVGLLVVAGLGGVVRWSLMPFAETALAFVPLQALHALTFGATHLAAMHFITRTVAPEQAATAQSIYSALAGGIIAGAVMMTSGALYSWLGGQAFFAMTVLCVIATVLGAGLLLTSSKP
jgi:PPP family 3-phenylpropionic acid transporter